jgi:hypothetical protein
MSDLLQEVFDANGGLDPWREAEVFEANVTYGGPFWELKGVPELAGTDHVVADIHRQHIVMTAASGRRIEFDKRDDVVTISDPAGDAERLEHPRASFAGLDFESGWTLVQGAYFRAYATWTYLVDPYLLAFPGVEAEEIEPWEEDGEAWRRLRVTFPDGIDTHSPTQVYYYDQAGKERRLDYAPEVNGDAPTAHYDIEHAAFDGVDVVTKHEVHVRKEDGTADLSFVAISVDVADVSLR